MSDIKSFYDKHAKKPKAQAALSKQRSAGDVTAGSKQKREYYTSFAPKSPRSTSNPSSRSLDVDNMQARAASPRRHSSMDSPRGESNWSLSSVGSVGSQEELDLGELPAGWSVGKTFDGKTYFINALTRSTTWLDPRTGRTHTPSTQGQQQLSVDLPEYEEEPLPNGWEIGQTKDGLPYFIDHVTKKTSWQDPRTGRAHPRLAAMIRARQQPQQQQQQQQHQQQHQQSSYSAGPSNLSVDSGYSLSLGEVEDVRARVAMASINDTASPASASSSSSNASPVRFLSAPNFVPQVPMHQMPQSRQQQQQQQQQMYMAQNESMGMAEHDALALMGSADLSVNGLSLVDMLSGAPSSASSSAIAATATTTTTTTTSKDVDMDVILNGISLDDLLDNSDQLQLPSSNVVDEILSWI